MPKPTTPITPSEQRKKIVEVKRKVVPQKQQKTTDLGTSTLSKYPEGVTELTTYEVGETGQTIIVRTTITKNKGVATKTVTRDVLE